jgi:hypothetical protein
MLTWLPWPSIINNRQLLPSGCVCGINICSSHVILVEFDVQPFSNVVNCQSGQSSRNQLV